MILAPVLKRETNLFRQMLVQYWEDLIPDAPFLHDTILAEALFMDRYRWDGGDNNPIWAIVEGHRIGFLMYRIYEDNVTAYIHDFFIADLERRQGHGTEMARELLSLFKDRGITRINLSVLPDNPIALSFWSKHGFEISYYRLTRLIDSIE